MTGRVRVAGLGVMAVLTSALYGPVFSPPLAAAQQPAPVTAAIQIDARPAGAPRAGVLLQQSAQAPAIQLEQTTLQTGALGAAVAVADVDSAPLREVLSGFAQTSGLNLAMSPHLDRPVSVDIRNATIGEALETVLGPLNLEYRVEGKILRVYEPQMIDATLEFDYITTARTRRSTAAANVVLLGSGASGSSVSLDAIDNANLGEEIEKLLQGLKSKEGDIQPNRMLGLYFVRDYPRNISRMRSALDQLQAAADRQVVIEARFLEVVLNPDSQSGIDWNTVFATVSAASRTFVHDSSAQLTLAPGDFAILTSALAKYGEVQTLAAPTVSTLNNQPVVVRLGSQDVFFSTSFATDPKTGAIVQTNKAPSTTSAGVVLSLTPRISADGTIYMNIHPVISERTGQIAQRGDSAPVLDLRETDTAIRVKNENSVLISGLILKTNANYSGTAETRKTELVILLTPRIVTD